jgi:hypothetical protein
MTRTINSPNMAEEAVKRIPGEALYNTPREPGPSGRQVGEDAYQPGPNECGLCDGTGIIHWQENMAPDGEGYWPMAFYDYCPDCLALGLCPLCGQKTINDDWHCIACSYRGPMEE